MAKIEVRKGRRSPMPMHKAEKARDLQARLKWLLDFLNTDIDSLNSVECLKLFLDFAVFIYGRSYFELIQKEFPIQPESDLTQTKRFLNKSQEILGVNLEEILMAKEEIGQESAARIPHGFDTFSVWYHVGVTKDRVFKYRHFYSLTPPFDRVLADEDENIGLIYRGLLDDALIEILSRFPLSRIKTCQKPDCENYFYQKTTKSKGDFCSPKCQNWARTNRWRQNHRDDYNKYHRDRRGKAKEDRIKLKCRSRSCGYQGTEELFEDYLKRYSEPEDCPQCKKTKLLHIIRTWEKGQWVVDAYAVDEWEKYVKKFKQGRDNHG